MRSQDSQNGKIETNRGGIMNEILLQKDMKELTKSYYDALKRVKELNEENAKLKKKVNILDNIAKYFMNS